MPRFTIVLVLVGLGLLAEAVRRSNDAHDVQKMFKRLLVQAKVTERLLKSILSRLIKQDENNCVNGTETKRKEGCFHIMRAAKNVTPPATTSKPTQAQPPKPYEFEFVLREV